MPGHFGSWLISIGFINRHALHFWQICILLLDVWANDTKLIKWSFHFLSHTKYVQTPDTVYIFYIHAKCHSNDRMKNYWDKMENIVAQSWIKHAKLNAPLRFLWANSEINENDWNAYIFFFAPFFFLLAKVNKSQAFMTWCQRFNPFLLVSK